jgi:hypothetical protein
MEEEQRVFMPAHITQPPPSTTTVAFGREDALPCTVTARAIPTTGVATPTVGVTHPYAQFTAPNSGTVTILTHCQQPQPGVKAEGFDARKCAG